MSDSRFRRFVRTSAPALNSLLTGALDGSVVLYLRNRIVTVVTRGVSFPDIFVCGLVLLERASWDS